MKSILINLYGGPGSGKSTSMAGIFHELKMRGINAEIAPEWAKEKCWEKSFVILENQIYVFGKQLHTIARLDGQVDVIVTDSPLLLSLIYANPSSVPLKEFTGLVLAVSKRYRTLSYFIRRKKGVYNPKGRMQTEEQSIEIDGRIRKMLKKHKIKFSEVDRGKETVAMAVRDVLKMLKKV